MLHLVAKRVLRIHLVLQKWMSILARASAEALAVRLASLPPLPAGETLRAPETGLVMVRGRAGGDRARGAGARRQVAQRDPTRCRFRPCHPGRGGGADRRDLPAGGPSVFIRGPVTVGRR